MAARIRQFAWEANTLGPVETWPRSLRAALGIMLGSGYPMYIAWGPQFIQLYNDAYLPILGAKHPDALGLSTTVSFAEIWDVIGPMFRRVISAAEPTNATDQVLFLDRSGYPEECYFTFSYSPVPDDEAGVTGGVFVTALETTDKVIDERRLRTLGDLTSTCSQAKNEESVLPLAAEALQTNPHDLPFALLYLSDPERPAEPKVAGAAGIILGENHFFSDAARWMQGGDDISQDGVFLIDRLSERMPSLPTGAWTIPPNQAAVVPLSKPGDTAPAGYLLCGLNPHKKFDQKYKAFLTRVAGHISISLAEARAFDEQRKRSEALAQIDRTKTTFFTNVSHEFRTPLTLMLGPLQEVLDRHTDPGGPFADEVRQLSMVHRNGVRLLKLVNALLDFSRIEAGRDTAKYEPMDLAAYTTDLASLFRSATEKAGLELIVDCHPLEQIAIVDREMWEKIVLNLISNAFKFTLQGSITVRLYENSGAAVLEVTDTGVGIPENHVLRIFDRFHRIEGTEGRTIEGTGIGLALVHELVKLHGGSIDVKTRVGFGTTFTVAVPLRPRAGVGANVDIKNVDATIEQRERPMPQLAHGYVDEALRWLPGDVANEMVDAPESEREHILDGSRILIADDNADMRDYLKKLFAEEYEIETVANGRDALAAVARKAPDLILSDAMMPILDGFGFLRAIRESEETHHIPFIMLSARAGQEARIEGLRAGLDDYIVKPFSGRELLARVHGQLKLSHLRREASAREQGILAETEAERLKLRDMFRVAPASMVFLSGPEHRIILANELYVKLVGRDRPDELIGKNIRQALPEVTGQGYFEMLDRVYNSGVAISGREAPVVLGKDARLEEQRYVDFSYQPTFNAQGAVDGILVHVVDVTEQVNSRKRVEESEKRFRVIADASPVLIWTSSVDGAVDYVNRGWLEFVGSSIDNEVGDGWTRNVHPDDLPTSSSEYAAALERRVPFETQYRLKHQSGEYRAVLNRGVPRFDSAGSFSGYIGVGLDIENQKRAEDALRKTEKLSAVGRLASTIAHEINNPLEAVTNLLYLISQYPMDEEMRTYLKAAEEELTRVTHIVTHSLKFHRQASTAQPELMSTLLNSILTVYQRRLQNSGLVLKMEFCDRLPVTCFGSEVRQVFSNLIANAIDASSNGGRIIVRTRDTQDRRTGTKAVRVTVADEGTGMDAKTISRLFEPFFSTKGISGTGLGLWVSKGILENNNARIGVKSRQGERSGTVFSIVFPCKAEAGIRT